MKVKNDSITFQRIATWLFLFKDTVCSTALAAFLQCKTKEVNLNFI